MWKAFQGGNMSKNLVKDFSGSNWVSVLFNGPLVLSGILYSGAAEPPASLNQHQIQIVKGVK